MSQVELFVLVVGAVGITALCRRSGWSAPLVLVAAGLVVSFVPGVPRFEVDSTIILELVLPLLLYSAALSSSYQDFRRARNSILRLGVGLVLVTAAAVAVVAVVACAIVPERPITAALVLGAVVAPPDAVAAVLAHAVHGCACTSTTPWSRPRSSSSRRSPPTGPRRCSAARVSWRSSLPASTSATPHPRRGTRRGCTRRRCLDRRPAARGVHVRAHRRPAHVGARRRHRLRPGARHRGGALARRPRHRGPRPPAVRLRDRARGPDQSARQPPHAARGTRDGRARRRLLGGDAWCRDPGCRDRDPGDRRRGTVPRTGDPPARRLCGRYRTLLLQGLSLPWVIRRLSVEEHDDAEHDAAQEAELRLATAAAAQQVIESKTAGWSRELGATQAQAVTDAPCTQET